MIFSEGLKVFSQMLDPAGEKRNLYIRAAGIFLMQLELLETRRLVALCHNKGANLDEDRSLATHSLTARTAASLSGLTLRSVRVGRHTIDEVVHASAPCGARR